MFKLMDKQIIEILCSKSLLNWPYGLISLIQYIADFQWKNDLNNLHSRFILKTVTHAVICNHGPSDYRL